MSADCLLGAPIADLLILTSISYFLCFYLSVGPVMMSLLSLSDLVLTVSFLPVSVWTGSHLFFCANVCLEKPVDVCLD